MRPVNAWESKVQRLVVETKLTARPDVMNWTVFQLMTDIAVMEKAKDNAVLLDIMRQLDQLDWKFVKAEDQCHHRTGVS